MKYHQTAKNCFFALFLVLSAELLHAQFGPQQVISTSTTEPYIATPMDINGDGFLDIISGSLDTFELSYYKNTNDSGTFEEKIVINSNPVSYISLQQVDIDGDGDQDLLFIENNPNRLVWLENLDGVDNFSDDRVIISDDTDFKRDVVSKDMDEDGDQDLVVLFSDTFKDNLVWYENTDGLGDFGSPTTILEDMIEISALLFEDLNNDGRDDLLIAHENNGPAAIVWYEQLPDFSYSEASVLYEYAFRGSSTNLSDLTSIYGLQYVDVNADQIPDLVYTANHDDLGTDFVWMRNNNGDPDFDPPIVLTPDYRSGNFYDFDNDGDNDLLINRRTENEIAWVAYNETTGEFSPERIITTEVDAPLAVSAGDLNSDGIIDVTSASRFDNKVAWYENSGVLGVEAIATEFKISIYPVPTNDILFIDSDIEDLEAELYTSTGQRIAVGEASESIDLSHLAVGIYYLRIILKDSINQVFKVIKT